jgi:uncharacterized protein (DUF58 family)
VAKAYRHKYLRPEQVRQMAGMQLIARTVVEGFVTGLHRSPHHGFSTEFSDHRQYVPGDELRHLDWLALARTDRYFVKRYEQETNLRCYVLLDCSASMAYGSGGISKFEYGCYLAATLAYLMVRQQDSVGLVLFDEAIRRNLPPRSTATHLNTLLEELERTTPGRQTGVSRTIHDVAGSIRRRALVVLISDLYDDPAEVRRALQHFRHRRHEVIVFHVLDPFELDFPFTKLVGFEDMETGEQIQIDPKQVRQTYQEEIGAFLADLRRTCSESRIEYVLADTRTPFERMLVKYLSRRRQFV